MSNLTAQQVAAIAGGQPIRQTWTIRGVQLLTLSGPSYMDTVIDDGVFSGPGSLRRVTRPGSRKHAAWNPHPMEDAKVQAVRYSIEVDNADGFFHRKAGSVWSPGAYGYVADPSECFLLHSLYVWIPDLYSPSWSPIEHMDFIGKVKTVEYTGGASKTGITSGSVPAVPAPNRATITCEQEGADVALRRVFRIEDADYDRVTDTTSGDVSYAF